MLFVLGIKVSPSILVDKASKGQLHPLFYGSELYAIAAKLWIDEGEMRNSAKIFFAHPSTKYPLDDKLVELSIHVLKPTTEKFARCINGATITVFTEKGPFVLPPPSSVPDSATKEDLLHSLIATTKTASSSEKPELSLPLLSKKYELLPSSEKVETLPSAAKELKLSSASKVKRVRNQWIFYYMKRRDEIRAKEPETPCGEIYKIASDEWKAYTSRDKEPYVAMYKEDLKRYHKEMGKEVPTRRKVVAKRKTAITAPKEARIVYCEEPELESESAPIKPVLGKSKDEGEEEVPELM